MWAIILVGAFLVPILLIAALIRGGFRAWRDRIARRDVAKDFE